MMTPEQSASILSRMFGYSGPADQGSLDKFLASNPAAAARMGKYREAMKQMVNGTTIAGFAEGGNVGGEPSSNQIVGDVIGAGGTDPGVPESTGTSPFSVTNMLDSTAATDTTAETTTDPGLQAVTEGQQAILESIKPITPATVATMDPSTGLIAEGTGQLTGAAPSAKVATVGAIAKADEVKKEEAETYGAATVGGALQEQLAGLEAATGEVRVISAEQQTETAVADIKAAQGEAILMENPTTLSVQNDELISGSTVDDARIQEYMESIQYATADLSTKATVRGQLDQLMADYDAKNPPSWATGALRAANNAMIARGLGTSSIAGQAIVQAALEAALPIATADAQLQAQMEMQNLSNRQQRAMMVAQQRAAFLNLEFSQEFQARVQNAARIADVANMNFSAAQTIALENSRAANTVNIQNLSNRQAMIMAQAAALSNLEIKNLDNRQQAAVINAQNFLQMDLANLSNKQQMTMFKAQQTAQALFSDQAAVNAAAQFNASSKNQVNQFFAKLSSDVSMFNAAQTNAINQFNAGEKNAAAMFNANMANQRDMFNAQNALVVAQANAQWKQNIATINTKAQNDANLLAAKAEYGLTEKALDQVYQRERDIMAFAFTGSENAAERALKIILADKSLEDTRMRLDAADDAARDNLWTQVVTEYLSPGSSEEV